MFEWFMPAAFSNSPALSITAFVWTLMSPATAVLSRPFRGTIPDRNNVSPVLIA